MKVCGITRTDDFLAIEQLGVDFAGFIFHETSKRFAGAQPDALFQNLPSGRLKKTGVFVNEHAKSVLEKADRFRLDSIQLHGNEQPSYCEDVRKHYPVIKAFSVDAQFPFASLERYQNSCDFFLFDAKGKQPGGNGISFDWSLLRNYTLEVPFFLSGGITPQHAARLLAFRHPAFYGIDVNSGFEISPGIKNIPMLKTFIQQLKKPA